ncbi:hypothetical protein [Radiobacillus deserti]|uniref:DUF4083 domain-containing protein n=1 Tax=Radiobacillus deserti TaxID=2594883 RepID=A0A516KES2_9BACI|nr:hypothetical protein [Radiobacillus deserti]QDP39903.1 hypothetical protein FN924_06820 [Radiobacillus deserti]
MESSLFYFPFVAFIPFLISIGLAIFSIWFMLTLLRNQREKNNILKAILKEIKQNNHMKE